MLRSRGPRHDGVNEAVLQQVFGPLEALGQLFTDGLLDDAGPRKPDQRPRLCQHDIAQAGKAGGDAAGGGVGEHRDIQPPMLRKALDGSGGLGHLHQREDPLLHAGAAAGGKQDQGSLFLSAYSTRRVTFSPRAALMLPIKKRLSRTPAATFWPSMRPMAVTTPSPRPVRRRVLSSLAS